MGRKSFRIVKKRSSLKKRRGAIGKKSKAQRKSGSRRRIMMIRGGGKPKTILLIIDPQNDFIPESYTDTNGKGPTLPVPNAENDIKLLAEFLGSTAANFDEIHVSLDSHNLTHIAHLGFWNLNTFQINAIRDIGGVAGFRVVSKEKQPGKQIELYNPNVMSNPTIAGCENIKPAGNITINRKLKKVVDATLLHRLAVEYIEKLTALHNYDNTKPLPNTWPTHCILGTKGWEIYEPLANALKTDKYKDKVFIHEKGTNDLVEMYSIFKAEVSYPNLNHKCKIPEYTEVVPQVVASTPDNMNTPKGTRNYATSLNLDLISRLRGAGNENTVYVCGEAKTHCVKTSAEDLVGSDGKNVIMLYNVMSDIVTPSIFVGPRKKAFKALKDKGVQFARIEANAIVDDNDYNPEKDDPPQPTVEILEDTVPAQSRIDTTPSFMKPTIITTVRNNITKTETGENTKSMQEHK
jgi:nicotinamidase-related amidase